jgi:hypothetical protein
MGGNLIIDGITADRIPLTKIDKDFCSGIVACLRELNASFTERKGTPLWESIDESIFSGSSRHLFDGVEIIPDLASIKPTMGDIDVMFDRSHSYLLGGFLRKSAGKAFGNFRLVGEGGNSLLQYNCIFEALHPYAEGFRYVQVDFEPVEFDEDGPSIFAQYAHSSQIEDLRAGIKGVFGKYLLRSLISNVEKIQGTFMTPTGRVSQSKRFSVPVGMWKFSVDKGVRKAFNGLPSNRIYEEILPENSVYITDLHTIFRMALQIDYPLSFMEACDMHSFCGTLRMMQAKMKYSVCERVYEDFINLLWGPDAQVLYRDDQALDSYEKFLAAQEFLRVFPEFNSLISLNTLKSSFYS